ncbi:hypothetical protein PPTS312_28690 [Pseudomonas putida]|uniref:Uncharacterized protein n=1 Tax=Pseudomonas putida TaxID=303 RepID=A0A7U6RCX7_PSEPU|nr:MULTISPECIES: hypothetical protein [Pseudomonas]MDD2124158.1 hypothetical protein [Pseudomonas monteilii]BBU44954.1 hypothetical protein PPTS312_28690 [Pseudomonas putida]
MASLWEPVGGVFWSVPPNDGWVHWPIAIVLLFVAVAVVGIGARIASKRKEPEWHLRQHMVEIGGALTLVYLVGITALTWGRIGTLGDMPLNEVGDFLAGAFGPVAFLWLVLGFLQQGDELRLSTKALEDQAGELKRSVQHQSTMATAALEQMEAQRATLQMQIDERDEALRAIFSIESGYASYVSGLVRNTIIVRNNGADATDLVMTFEPEIPGVGLRLLDMRSGGQESYSFNFNDNESPRNGRATITYYDRVGVVRHQSFVYELDEATDTYEFKRYYEG